MNQMPISQIVFGKTDAFNEHSSFGQDFFISSFVANPKYHINEFMNGSRFFISGKKGTGKSALLKYLECCFTVDKGNLVFTIRFRKDIEQIDRDSFEHIASNADVVLGEEKIDVSTVSDQTSYVLVWKTFLINQIITRANAGKYCVFKKTDKYNQLISLLKCIYGESQAPSIVMPKITRGSIALTANYAESLSAGLKLELEFDAKKKRINYAKLSKKVYELFCQLEFDCTPVYILIDELELSVRNKYQFTKDVSLVRDLIIAIDDMNNVSNQKGMDIHIIAAIRSEVVKHVRSSGYELTKSIEDRGIEINWFQKGGSYLDNPLLDIIENKVRASEQRGGYAPAGDVWTQYFARSINGEETRKFILDNTLYRPRDVIRLMTTVHNQIGTSNEFVQEVFDKAQQDYSELLWTEIKDELRLSYTEEEVDAISTLLNRITIPFSFDSLLERIEQFTTFYPNISVFSDRGKLFDVLKKLYELGVIGNTGKPMNFIFLNRPTLDPLGMMVIHTPLRNYFSVQYEKLK